MDNKKPLSSNPLFSRQPKAPTSQPTKQPHATNSLRLVSSTMDNVIVAITITIILNNRTPNNSDVYSAETYQVDLPEDGELIEEVESIEETTTEEAEAETQ